MNTSVLHAKAISDTALVIDEQDASGKTGSLRIAEAAECIPLFHPLNAAIKRTIDLFFSTCMIVLVFPWLFPIIALSIKIFSRGPVFFLQKRHKRNGLEFWCLKFRTMVVNDQADELPATENDWRITKIGRALRRYHLDELPQVLNVWWGDMSLVGPRPYMLKENQQFSAQVANYQLRHQVKPGITGLAQCMGKYGFLVNDHALQERVALDHFYVRKWKLRTDFSIILKTVGQLWNPQANP